MNQLPPEDQPHSITIGPVGPIPIHYDDDPRLDAERAAWKEAAAHADSLLSADELLGGTRDRRWRVRFWVLDRLVARARHDARVAPALIDLLDADPSPAVRDKAAMKLIDFGADPRVQDALRAALHDPDADVRDAAAIALEQIG